MLLNKITETRKIFEDYNEMYSKQQKFRKISSFSQTMKTEFAKIKSILASFHALLQMDPEAFPKKKLSYEMKKLEEFKTKGLQSYSKDEVFDFSRLFRSLDDDLKIRWANYVLNKNKDIIGLLKNLQNIVTNPEEMKQLISNLQTFEKKWPVTSISLNHYQEHFESANKVIAEMDVSEGVQEFITKVATNQATLDDLTDEVISWIRTKRLTNKIVIKFK